MAVSPFDGTDPLRTNRSATSATGLIASGRFQNAPNSLRKMESALPYFSNQSQDLIEELDDSVKQITQSEIQSRQRPMSLVIKKTNKKPSFPQFPLQINIDKDILRRTRAESEDATDVVNHPYHTRLGLGKPQIIQEDANEE